VGEVGRQPEPSRHDADDLHGYVVQENRPTDDGRIATVAGVPQIESENGNRRAVRYVLFYGEDPAEVRAHAEHVERVGGDEADANPERRTTTSPGLLTLDPHR